MSRDPTGNCSSCSRGAGILSLELSGRLGDMAGFRNVLVHGYGDVDLQVVVDVIEHRLDDLLEFVRALRPRLGGCPG